MTPTSWFTFALITGFVWGGFLFLLTLALRRESRKEERAEEE